MNLSLLPKWKILAVTRTSQHFVNIAQVAAVKVPGHRPGGPFAHQHLVNLFNVMVFTSLPMGAAIGTGN